MPETPRQAFFKSPHHATLGLIALTAAVFGGALGAIGGAVAYVLGWLYLPDMGFFARWRESKVAEQLEKERQAALGEFAVQRDALLGELHESRRERYAHFLQTCQQVAMGQDPRARKLEEMQWTYLRLLTIEQSLEVFLEGERRDGVPILLSEAEDEVAALEKEIGKMQKAGETIPMAREKLLESRRSRLDVLRQRAARIEEATGNLQLASAELDRLEEQSKLIRADAVAAKNATSMGDRIDATFEHLAQTNRWLSEMDAFRDQLGDLPEGGMGVRSPLATAPLEKEWQRRKEAQK